MSGYNNKAGGIPSGVYGKYIENLAGLSSGAYGKYIEDNNAAAASTYDWNADSQMLSRYRADTGNVDLVSNSAFGALTQPNGAVAISAGAIDGHSCWSFVRAGTPRLVTTLSPDYFSPITIIVIGRQTSNGGAPANIDGWMQSTGGGIAFQYTNSSSFALQGVTIPATPTNWNAIHMCIHSTETRYSVNGAPYTKAVANSSSIVRGLTIGGRTGGTFGAGVDIAEIIIIEGQPNALLQAGLAQYLSTTYPSIGISSTPLAQFSVFATSLNGLFSGPFDIITVAGQSNCCNYILNSTTASPGSNVYMLGNDNTVKALSIDYDAALNQLDLVSADGTINVNGGMAISLANTYAAASGRPCVIVPCGRGASGFTAANPTGGKWDVTYPRGLKLRDSLYGSMVQRTLNMIALGGTFRFLYWYQGETEAVLGGQTTFQASTQSLLDNFAADVGTDRAMIQKISINTPSAPNLTTIRAAQDALAVANKRLVLPSWDGTMDSVGSVHLDATGANTVGAAAANTAISLGSPWI